MNTIVRFLPIADPGIVVSVENIYNQQSHLWVADGDEASLMGWVQQMRRVVSVLSPFTGTKVLEATTLFWGVRPLKFCVWLKRHLRAECGGTDLAASRRDIK